MRNELNQMEQIENYLLGKMDASEKNTFEQQVMSDPQLKAEIEKQQLLMEGITRNTIKESIRTSGKNYFFKKTLFKLGLGITGLIAAASIALLLNRDVQKADNLFVNPPLPGVTIPYCEFIVNPATGLDTTFPSGSAMRIPKYAFLDGNGKLADHPVMLKYREFLDPLDFFLSGIPMQYDSAGKKYEFESGGMFEINAFQDGAPLKVNPVNPIQVQLISNNPEHSFNRYFLDTVAHNWVYKGKPEIREAAGTCRVADSSEATTGPEKEWKEAQKKVLALENHKPCEPKKLDESKYNFNIAADPDEFPELALYRGMRFEVSDENKDFTSAMYKTVWEDVTIKENIPGVNYKITLRKDETERSVIVSPVFKGADYHQAVKVFKKNFSKYNELLSERKAEQERAYKHYLVEQGKNDMQTARNSVSLMHGQLMQTLMVDGFGFWNSDWPIILPKGALLWLMLVDDNGEQIKNPDCYLVDKERNSLFHYYPKTLSRFEFNPQSESVMWAVGEKGLYIFTRDDFKKVEATSGKYTFKMKSMTGNINSKESLKTVLGI